MHVNILWTAQLFKKARTVLPALDFLFQQKKTFFFSQTAAKFLSCAEEFGFGLKEPFPVNCKKCKC